MDHGWFVDEVRMKSCWKQVDLLKEQEHARAKDLLNIFWCQQNFRDLKQYQFLCTKSFTSIMQHLQNDLVNMFWTNKIFVIGINTNSYVPNLLHHGWFVDEVRMKSCWKQVDLLQEQ
jgi:hypothetical protein